MCELHFMHNLPQMQLRDAESEPSIRGGHKSERILILLAQNLNGVCLRPLLHIFVSMLPRARAPEISVVCGE